MARNYKPGHCNATARRPANWTDVTPHKYCGVLDLGREGRPNKAQACPACLAVKARVEGQVKRDADARRKAKMTWAGGGFDG